MTIFKTVVTKVTLTSKKNKSTFKQGMNTHFKDVLEVIHFYIDGIYKGSRYEVNKQDMTKEGVKSLLSFNNIDSVKKYSFTL